MDKLALWIGLVGSVFGIISLTAGFFLWYGAGVRKRYAAERDFNHLKAYYETLAKEFVAQSDLIEKGFQTLSKEQDLRFDRVDKDLSEIKAFWVSRLTLMRREEDRDS